MTRATTTSGDAMIVLEFVLTCGFFAVCGIGGAAMLDVLFSGEKA